MLRFVPESIEVELYRQLAERTVGRRVVGVDAPDAWFLKGGLTGEVLAGAAIGHQISAARRIGKLLLVDLDAGPTLGLRFGMTGRLTVDGDPGVDRLEYSPLRYDPAWDRVTFRLEGGDMRINDPRRLGGVLLEPDESKLGVDVFDAQPADLRRVLTGSAVALKARLLDQHRIAGIGNLLADEALWRAGLDPSRPSASLTPNELRRLHKHLRATVVELTARGGSHTGDSFAARRPGGTCPRDGRPMQRATIGGRTTWWCPHHQH
jgi:formamidopyrimidine-DNA glycosylase